MADDQYMNADAAMSALASLPDDDDAPAPAEAKGQKPEETPDLFDDEEVDAAADEGEAGEIEDSEADESTAEDDVDGEPEEAIAEDDEDAEQDEPDLPAIDPPQFLDPSQRESFGALPREAQEMLVQHDKALVADYTRKTQEAARTRKEAENRLGKLKDVRTEREQRIQDWKSVDWVQRQQELTLEAEKQGVPFSEVLKQINLERAQMDKEFKEFDELQKTISADEEETYAKHCAETRESLEVDAPHLLAPKTGDERRREILNFAFDNLQRSGMDAETAQERLKWLGAFEWRILDEALQWRTHKLQIEKKPVLKPKPDAKSTGRKVKPAARPSSSNKQNKAVRRFSQTRSSQDAMAALLEIDD